MGTLKALRSPLIATLALVAVVACQPAAPARAPAAPADAPAAAPAGGAPTEAIVRQLILDDYASRDDTTTRHAVDIRAVQIAQGRPGDFLGDGTPENTQTTVYPTRVDLKVDFIAKATEQVFRTTDEVRVYRVWRDQFGNWVAPNYTIGTE